MFIFYREVITVAALNELSNNQPLPHSIDNWFQAFPALRIRRGDVTSPSSILNGDHSAGNR